MSISLAQALGLDVTITFDSNAEEQAAKDKAILDEVGAKALKARQEVLRTVRQGIGMINTMMSALNITTRALRLTIDPFHQALLSLISTTVATISSVAAALATTGVGIAAAAIIGSAAVGLQFGILVEVSADMQAVRLRADALAGRVEDNRIEIQSFLSGLGGL